MKKQYLCSGREGGGRAVTGLVRRGSLLFTSHRRLDGADGRSGEWIWERGES